MKRNRLLRALPQPECDLVRDMLQPVSLKVGETIQEAGEPLRYVYFPAEALLSTMIVMGDGSAVECGSIGCDGVFGSRFMVGLRLPGRTLCQVPGDAFRVRSSVLFARMGEVPVLRSLIYRYSQYLYVMTSQLLGCNCLHSITQRCARWLLSTRDCLGRDEFDLTQEFLAMMLGVRRASVTGAIGKLQHAGHIKYRRGCVTIVRPKGLERAACECYHAMLENRKAIIGTHA